MVRSMTGFGKATCEWSGEPVSVEVSAVNHRYLDMSVRLPYAWSELEAPFRETARKVLSRGKLNISVTRKKGTNGEQSLRVNTDVAEQYILTAKELSVMLGTGDALSLDTLMRLEGIFVFEEGEQDMERLCAAMVACLEEALTRLNEMRAKEGEALQEEVLQRLASLEQLLAGVEERLPEIQRHYEDRLRTRLAELVSDTNISEERLAMEVAMMGDKADVTEEVVRLKAHFDHVRSLFAQSSSLGRELNFLVQEIQREINTLGVKTRDSDTAKDIVTMKSELEKIREQIQNIE